MQYTFVVCMIVNIGKCKWDVNEVHSTNHLFRYGTRQSHILLLILIFLM